VRKSFEGIIEHHATLIEGAAFTFADTDGVTFPCPLAMIDDAFQSRRDPIVVPGANMEFAMQLIMTSLLQDLVGEARKPPGVRWV
jgi:phosphoribulokinase